MKTVKTIVVLALAAIIGGVVVRVAVVNREIALELAKRKAAPNAGLESANDQIRPVGALAAAPVSSEGLPSDGTTNAPDSKPSAESVDAAGQGTEKSPARGPQPSQPLRTKEEVQDPWARVALSFVGADPDAEQYWIAAINDARLSPHERQDLIEDLNEDGLSDPRNPTEEDLPLIVNRILLIGEIAPDAMDQVNADAFQEAYKDLVNMYVRLIQP